MAHYTTGVSYEHESEKKGSGAGNTRTKSEVCCCRVVLFSSLRCRSEHLSADAKQTKGWGGEGEGKAEGRSRRKDNARNVGTWLKLPLCGASLHGRRRLKHFYEIQKGRAVQLFPRAFVQVNECRFRGVLGPAVIHGTFGHSRRSRQLYDNENIPAETPAIYEARGRHFQRGFPCPTENFCLCCPPLSFPFLCGVTQRALAVCTFAEQSSRSSPVFLGQPSLAPTPAIATSRPERPA